MAAWIRTIVHGHTMRARVIDGEYRCPICRELHRAVW
jgi:hypothetical protein